jgi:trehalose 2-sulfotransferase
MYTHHKLDHEFEGGAATAVTYAVCALPRSGSSLLCELLFNTRLAGAPAEYFDAAMRRQFSRRWGTESFEQYVRALLDRKTGPNGVFGFKAHFFQLDDTFPGSRLADTFPGLRHVYITRNDTLRQAISWARAIQTRKWASDHEVKVVQGGEVFRRSQIDKLIAGIAERERRWEGLFAAARVEPLRISYEDLVAAPQETIGAVLGHIGIDHAGSVPLGSPTLQRQADGLTEDWVSRYLDEGAPAAVSGVARW